MAGDRSPSATETGGLRLIHQYDAIDREQTWLTLSVDLPEWHAPLEPKIEQAESDPET